MNNLKRDPDFGAPHDPAQVIRIEAVHRGFLYQHLYGVACLLTCVREDGTTMLVERDEDIEVIGSLVRTYVQIKTRQKPLQFGDIESALKRFEELRKLHQSGERFGEAKLVIVINVETGPGLRKSTRL
ncbi:dsDNA nuclease domain-containing protein [Hyphomicrobium sp.]|uniref:dsDNA nuclease domain-containing protein n=1 Tax=Hyphomicrobium sp. TaxID=82 RepID=UPI0035630468